MSHDDPDDGSPATGEPEPSGSPQSDPAPESQIVANPTEQEHRGGQGVQKAERRSLGE